MAALASKDYEAIVTYLHAANQTGLAARFHAELHKTLALVAEFPGIGQRVPDTKRPTRLRSVRIARFGNYRAFYADTGDEIAVLRIIDMRGDIPRTLGE